MSFELLLVEHPARLRIVTLHAAFRRSRLASMSGSGSVEALVAQLHAGKKAGAVQVGAHWAQRRHPHVDALLPIIYSEHTLASQIDMTAAHGRCRST